MEHNQEPRNKPMLIQSTNFDKGIMNTHGEMTVSSINSAWKTR